MVKTDLQLTINNATIKGMEKARNPKIKKGFKMHLRTKNCVVCDKPFQFRKKWEDCWDEVKYCSERCRSNKKMAVKFDSSKSDF
jgi:hypothetical protein